VVGVAVEKCKSGAKRTGTRQLVILSHKFETLTCTTVTAALMGSAGSVIGGGARRREIEPFPRAWPGRAGMGGGATGESGVAADAAVGGDPPVPDMPAYSPPAPPSVRRRLRRDGPPSRLASTSTASGAVSARARPARRRVPGTLSGPRRFGAESYSHPFERRTQLWHAGRVLSHLILRARLTRSGQWLNCQLGEKKRQTTACRR
jgi:hypothetical protein